MVKPNSSNPTIASGLESVLGSKQIQNPWGSAPIDVFACLTTSDVADLTQASKPVVVTAKVSADKRSFTVYAYNFGGEAGAGQVATAAVDVSIIVVRK